MSFLNIKLVTRGILKNKLQLIINVFGFGIGLGCVLLLVMLFLHENSFDRHFSDHNRLYRVVQGESVKTTYTLAEDVQNEIAAVENNFRYYQSYEIDIKNHMNEIIKQRGFAFSDISFFNCYGVELIHGFPARLKTDVAISESMALKYFNEENPVGEVLNVKLNNIFLALNITGVFEDMPSNATLNPGFVAYIDLASEAMGSQKKQLGQYGEGHDDLKSRDRFPLSTFLMLRPNVNSDDVARSIQKFSKATQKEERKTMAFTLQPVSDIYLHSESFRDNTFHRQGNANELKYYLAIAALILLIAIVNYIFLGKSKIENKLKDIGIQKAIGATQNTIKKQVVLEALLITSMSIIPAIFVIAFGMKFFDSTFNRQISSGVFSMWFTYPLLLIIVIVTALISGYFAGNKVSKLQIRMLLTGKLLRFYKMKYFGNSFLILHFVIFITLVIGVTTLKKQINFALTNFQAINTENIIICELNTKKLSKQFNVIKAEIDKMPGVQKTAGSSFIPPFNWFLPVNLAYENEKVKFDGLIMGDGMIELLGMKVIEGESFNEYQEGQNNMIFNESAAKKYNLKAGELFNGFNVQGIVKDFNAHSLHRLIEPMVIMQQNPEKMRLFAVKTNGFNDEIIKTSIEKLFNELSPGNIQNIYSLQEQINQFYPREEQQSKLVSVFSVLALILLVMGLFGMTQGIIIKKQKEIGVRKVNGAKTIEVLSLLNKDFIKWVVFAFVLASPIAYYLLNKWLESFAYKTTINWWVFVFAGIFALVIALITVSWQTFKAARKNPVEALRYE